MVSTLNCLFFNMSTKWTFVIGVTCMIVIANFLTIHLIQIDPTDVDYSSKDTIFTKSFHLRVQVIFFILSLYTYYKTSLTPPGSTKDWKKERPDLQCPNVETTVKEDVEGGRINFREEENAKQLICTDKEEIENERYCVTCKHHKPKRVHHCSECETCVLRFDHHCPWVGACIGLYNSKFFTLFLIYTTMLCFHSNFIALRFLYRCNAMPTEFHKLESTVIISVALHCPIILLIALPALFMVGFLLTNNLWLACRNQTTLENIIMEEELEAIEQQALENKQEINMREIEKEKEKQREYGNGDMISNLRHLFGWNMFLWLIPISQSRLSPHDPDERRCST